MATEAAHFDEWRNKLKALVAAAQQKQYDTVLQQGPAILALYPEYVDDANVYELMADADKAQGDAQSRSSHPHGVRARRRPDAGCAEATGNTRKKPRDNRTKPRQRSSGSTTSTRSRTKICIAGWAICFSRRSNTTAPSANTTLVSPRIP